VERNYVWDGVPENVLNKHKMTYEPQWLEKCVDQSRREIIALWDEDMRLIS